MSGQVTANDVALNLARLSRDLDDCVQRLNDADAEAVEARENLTLSYAKAFLTAEGAMEVRKHIATERTHNERLVAETADQVVRGLRRQVDTLRIRIDVGRSMGAALRAETALAGAS